VGPRGDARGGVAGTIRLLHASALADEFDLRVVATHRDGTPLQKLAQGVAGLGRLTWLCLGGRVALVHLHVASGASLLRKSVGLAVARARGVPVVLHVHGMRFATRRRVGLLQRRLLRWALERSDAVVALTPGWEERLALLGNVRRLRVVANAPDLAPRPPRRETSPGGMVLFLGHLYRDKGVYDLVDAFALVGAARPGLRLVLAGEGPEREGLRAHAGSLGVNGALELPGWVDEPAKAELLTRADCLVLPSHREGLPLAVLEAMHSGVPVVATAVGGIPEVVEHEREALLVPHANPPALAAALGRVLDDRELATRIAGAAGARARAEYTPGVLAERVAAVYREVLAVP
jgi:glycosyltransferase involved in cell wall biosynthesis